MKTATLTFTLIYFLLISWAMAQETQVATVCSSRRHPISMLPVMKRCVTDCATSATTMGRISRSCTG